MRRHHLTVGAATVVLAGFLATASAGAQPAGDSVPARITIDVDSMGQARVEAQFVMVDTGTVMLRLLDRPCVGVDALKITAAGAPVAYSTSRRGPWQELTLTNGSSGPAVLDVAYTVMLDRGGGDVPILHPARALRAGAGAEVHSVSITVSLPDAGTVRFPRLQRAGRAGTWWAGFIAIPSFVNVHLRDVAGRSVCTSSADAVPDDGGLTWRFWLLIGVMLVWVPLYLAWASRTGSSVR